MIVDGSARPIPTDLGKGRAHAATGALVSSVLSAMAAETRAAALETPGLEPSAKGNPTANGQNRKTTDSRIDGEPIRYHCCLPSVYLNA